MFYMLIRVEPEWTDQVIGLLNIQPEVNKKKEEVSYFKVNLEQVRILEKEFVTFTIMHH